MREKKKYPGLRAIARFAGIGSVALACAALAAGCGGSTAESADGGEGLPETIPVTWIGDLSGIGAYVGEQDERGLRLALEEIEEAGLLGDSKIELTVKDSGSDQATAASLVSQAAATDAVAILSPALGNESLAAAPIAQRNEIPFIAMQSQSPGIVETGEYIFRVTSMPGVYNKIIVDHLAEKGVKSAAMIYVSDNPTSADAGENIFPGHLENAGIEVVASEGTPATTTDFDAILTKVLAKNPDSVGTALLGSQYATVFKGLRDRGYEGELFAQDPGTPDILKAGGKASEGIIWATDYSPSLTYDVSKKFTEAYTAEYGPNLGKYPGEAHDAMMFLALGLKEADSVDRAALRDGLQKVADEGFEGVVGPLKFGGAGGRDAQALGALVTWDGNAEKLLSLGEASDSEEEGS